MQGTALKGAFADAPVEAARVFRSALNTIARPGRIETVTGAEPPAPLSIAAGCVLLTLCDPETPVFLAETHDRPEVRDWITFHCGAPLVEAGEARFALGAWDALKPLDRFGIGSAEYPDRSATLIVESVRLASDGAQLTGPGIRETAWLSLPEIEAFHANRALFPLGLDFFFTAGARLAALPRSTRVEAV